MFKLCQIHTTLQLFDLDNSNSIELDEFIAVASLNDRILGIKRTADEPLQLDLEQLSRHLCQYKVSHYICHPSHSNLKWIKETSSMIIFNPRK